MKFGITISLAVLQMGISNVGFAAQEPATTTTATAPAGEKSRDVGQHSYAEIGLQAGTMTGLKLKGLVYSGDKYNIGIEGLHGGSIFAGSAFFPRTLGAGIRSEFIVSSNGRNSAFMISPGLTGYYVPANRMNHPEAKDIGEAIGQAFSSAFAEVPTRVVLISPNVEFNYLFQPWRHFGLIAGLKLGTAIALNGSNSQNEELAGKTNPEVALSLGTRF